MMHIKAMIFAAGLGTRFKPWTDKYPKALALVNGKSLLQRNIEFLQQHGINDIVVNTHHFSDQIKQAIQSNHGWGSNVVISDETDEVLETGGGFMKAANLLRGSDLIITLNADILTSINIDKIVHYHYENKALISLAAMKREGSRHLLFDNSMHLCGWRNVLTGEERLSVPGQKTEPFSFSGIAVYSPSILDMIKRQGKFSLLDVFLDLAAENNIFGFDHTGDVFIDVGKPGSVEQAEKLFI